MFQHHSNKILERIFLKVYLIGWTKSKTSPVLTVFSISISWGKLFIARDSIAAPYSKEVVSKKYLQRYF